MAAVLTVKQNKIRALNSWSNKCIENEILHIALQRAQGMGSISFHCCKNYKSGGTAVNAFALLSNGCEFDSHGVSTLAF